MKKNNFIFIVGVGRSGTSLLQSMLNAHPEICFLPETGFLRSYVFKRKSPNFVNGKQKQDFINSLKNDARISRLKHIDINAIVEQSNSAIEVYHHITQSIDSTYVGDKDPRFLDFIPELHRFFPNSKVIHIIRDPRDVTLSRTKADWSKHWPFFMHPIMYHAQLERGRTLGKTWFKTNYLECYYEDLISKPEEVLTAISGFLNVAYNPAMLNFGDAAKKLVDPSEMQWKKETLGPLLTKNKDKWKRELTPPQLATIQAICATFFRKHPYTKQPVKTNLRQKGKLLVLRAMAFFFKIVYPLRIKFL